MDTCIRRPSLHPSPHPFTPLSKSGMSPRGDGALGPCIDCHFPGRGDAGAVHLILVRGGAFPPFCLSGTGGYPYAFVERSLTISLVFLVCISQVALRRRARSGCCGTGRTMDCACPLPRRPCPPTRKSASGCSTGGESSATVGRWQPSDPLKSDKNEQDLPPFSGSLTGLPP